MAGRKTELTRSLLLQGRRREWRLWIAGNGLGFNAIDAEIASLYRHPRGLGLCLGFQIHLVVLFAKIAQQPRVELLALMLHVGIYRPILLRPKRLNLALAFNDQAQRNRLHTACRFGPRQFAPQDRRKRKSNQIIKRAAGKIRLDQIDIQLARFGHRFQNCCFSNRIKCDALNILWQRFFLRKNFLHVPADRFAFAVRVGRKDQAVCLFGFIGDRFQLLGLVGIIIPQHGKAVIGINRPVLWRQVADMAVRSQHLETGAQIFLDCLGFCR